MYTMTNNNNNNNNNVVANNTSGGDTSSNYGTKSIKYYGLYMSIISGLFGAIGSCFGKIAFNNIQQLYNNIEVIIRVLLWKNGTNTNNTSSNNDLPTILPPIHPLLSVLTQTIITLLSNNNDDNEITTNNNTNAIIIINSSCQILIEQIIPRIICIILMILCNGFMLSTFLLSIQYNGTVSGTAICTASNMIFSTFFGYIIFNERISSATTTTTDSITEPTYYLSDNTIQWWIGFIMILLGVIMLSSTTTDTDNTSTNTTTKATTQESSTIAEKKGSYDKVKTI